MRRIGIKLIKDRKNGGLVMPPMLLTINCEHNVNLASALYEAFTHYDYGEKTLLKTLAEQKQCSIGASKINFIIDLRDMKITEKSSDTQCITTYINENHPSRHNDRDFKKLYSYKLYTHRIILLNRITLFKLITNDEYNLLKKSDYFNLLLKKAREFGIDDLNPMKLEQLSFS